MTENELHWVAGLFEGEGTILLRSPAKSAKGLRLTMTDQDVVNRFADTVGVGKIYPMKAESSRHKPAWLWSCTRWEEVEPLAEALLPLMGERRGAALRVLLENVPVPLDPEVRARNNATMRAYRARKVHKALLKRSAA